MNFQRSAVRRQTLVQENVSSFLDCKCFVANFEDLKNEENPQFFNINAQTAIHNMVFSHLLFDIIISGIIRASVSCDGMSLYRERQRIHSGFFASYTLQFQYLYKIDSRIQNISVKENRHNKEHIPIQSRS